MAIIDRQNMFSDAQALSGLSAIASTDIIDLQPLYSGIGGTNTARDLGVGEDIYLQVNVSNVTGTSPTLTIALQSDDNSSFTSAVALFTSGAIPLPAAGGQVLVVSLPFGDYEKFLRLNYTLGGTSPTATVKAALVRGVQAVRNYTDAVVIS
jgi:hypothetical protein